METADEEGQRKAQEEAEEWAKFNRHCWQLMISGYNNLHFEDSTLFMQAHAAPEPATDTSSFNLDQPFKRLNENGMHEFDSELEAYVYMWLASHIKVNGVLYAHKEHAAYVLNSGKVVLLPVNDNKSNASYTEPTWMKSRSGKYYLLGYRSPIVGYTHTHPMSTSPNISDKDYRYAHQRPRWTHKVIANGGRIYRIWGNGTHKQIGRLQ